MHSVLMRITRGLPLACGKGEQRRNAGLACRSFLILWGCGGGVCLAADERVSAFVRVEEETLCRNAIKQPAPPTLSWVPTAMPAAVFSEQPLRARSSAVGSSSKSALSFSDQTGWLIDPNAFQLTGELNDWRRLRVYKSRDSVRVLTLWSTDGLSVALQADRHGAPMLRWTSKEMSRGEASRGLLDGWFNPTAHDAD